MFARACVRRGVGALVSTKLIPKAPERIVGQARDYPLADSVRAAVPPPPASQAPPLRGGWCASHRSALAAYRRQPQNGLSGCAASTFAAGRRTIRSLEGCCKRGVVLLLLLVRRLSAYGVGTLSQTLLGLCPRPCKPFLRKRA